MGKASIPYYEIVNGRGYWCPTKRMKLAGFAHVPCGPDGPDAWAIASAWNDRWQAARRSEQYKQMLRDQPGVQRAGFVYFVKAANRIKIGFSTKPLSRIQALKTSIPHPIDLTLVVRGTKSDEARLHKRLAAYRTNGEWFAESLAVMKTIWRAAYLGRAPVDEKEQI